MAETLMQRLVETLPFLDDIAEDVQPKVQEAVAAGGTTARNVLDGVWLEAPLHPALTDVPVGAWTAALVFDGLDVATGKKPMRHAADASLVFGTLAAFGAAVTGLSDWRYLSGGSRRMGVAHGLLNTIGLVLSIVSLILRASGRRNAGRLTFLTGTPLVAWPHISVENSPTTMGCASTETSSRKPVPMSLFPSLTRASWRKTICAGSRSKGLASCLAVLPRARSAR